MATYVTLRYLSLCGGAVMLVNVGDWLLPNVRLHSGARAEPRHGADALKRVAYGPFIRTVRPARDLVGQLVEPVKDRRGGRLKQMSHRR